MRPEMIIPHAKLTINQLFSGETFNEEELHQFGLRHVGLVSHEENWGASFERIISGEPIPDSERTVFNTRFDENVMNLEPVPNGLSGEIGFIDFAEERQKLSTPELRHQLGKQFHLTYAGIESEHRGKGEFRNLFEGLKTIARRRGVFRISGEVHGYRFDQVFPALERVGFKRGTQLNDGRIKVGYKIKE